MINLGVIKSKKELPSGLISRTEASKYLDANTLEPMLPLIDGAGLVKYFAIVNGKIAEYLNLGEVQSWGTERGHAFWLSSEVSDDWRAYVRTLDRIYKDVDRLKALAKQMEFDKDEMKAVPIIKRQRWLWKPKTLPFCDPRLREAATLLTERDKTVPLSVYASLQKRYELMREKLIAITSSTDKHDKPPSATSFDKRFSAKRQNNRFFVRIRRWVLGEEVNLERSFRDRTDALKWGREISDELDFIVAMKRIETETIEPEPGWLSKIFFNPSEYLKASNQLLVEIAHKVVATEDPSADGRFIPIEAIHTHSIKFEDTLVCGIYFLIDRGEIVYVGQSIDVFKRIRDHRQEGYKIWDRFSMIPVRKEKLTEVERWYILHFRPRYNKARKVPYPSESKIHKIRVATEAAFRPSFEDKSKDNSVDCCRSNS